MYMSANESLVPVRFMLMVTHLIATLTVIFDSANVAFKSGAEDVSSAKGEYVRMETCIRKERVFRRRGARRLSHIKQNLFAFVQF